MSYYILLAEDDESIAKIIKMTLEIEKHHVFHAPDGLKANEALQSKKFDLALLDIMLPHFNGYELLEKAKNKNIPCIFISAKTDVVDKVTGLQLGAEDYIAKPFDTIELLARVNTALRRIKKEPSTFTVNGICLNLENHTVTKKGQPVDLTPLEYELLATLMKNPGMLFSRNQLLDIVWGYDYSGGTRTIDTHIQKLRAKLDLADIIRTIHKIGYKFEAPDHG